MNMIPKQVAMPVENSPDAGRYEHRIWIYVRNTLVHLGVDVVFDPKLKRPCWSAFEIRVDGQIVVIDYSDFLLVHPASAGYRHWLRIQYVVGFLPFPNLGSFPQYSFLDWEEYYRLAGGDPTPGDRIVHVQYIRPADGPATRDKVARRNLARRLLLGHFGDAVDVETTRTLQEYFKKGMNSLVSVHIPGNWRHCLDRGHQQLTGLGVCTVSPEIWTVCLDERPQPWQHYVPLQHDYSDLPERIRWCLGNRDECLAIGRRAKDFFSDPLYPESDLDLRQAETGMNDDLKNREGLQTGLAALRTLFCCPVEKPAHAHVVEGFFSPGHEKALGQFISHRSSTPRNCNSSCSKELRARDSAVAPG